MAEIDLAYAIGLPPEQAIAYFRAKGYQISWDWHTVRKEAHAKSFTVAKAMRTDILEDLRVAVDKALAEGRSFEQFRKELTPILQAKGWWGKHEMLGEGGELYQVQLGSPRRLRTIYQTNLQTAYMAGRYQAMMENVKARPYWMYVAVLDSRTRPAHRALHGKVFRYDDPIWLYLYPPNGWLCRCRVRALSASDIEARGLKVESSQGRISFVDRPLGRTGETVKVASYGGIGPDGRRFNLTPDVGWDYNPGRSAPLWSGPAREMAIVPGQKTFAEFGRPSTKNVAAALRPVAPEKLPPVGEIGREAWLAQARKQLGLGEGEVWRAVATVDGDLAVLHMQQIEHLLVKADGRERYLPYLLPTLTNAFETYLTAYDNGVRQELRKIYVGLFADRQRREDIAVIVRLERDGSLFWNAFEREKGKIDKLRVGQLLYPQAP